MDSNFDLKLDIYCHQLRETNIDSYGTKKWFSIIKETVMQKNSLQSNKKAINFQLLKTKHLTLQDSSDIVESYDLDSSRTSSGSSSSSSSLTNSSFCKSLKLFGQICCRLSVAPYCRTEAVRLERRSWIFICLWMVNWWVRWELLVYQGFRLSIFENLISFPNLIFLFIGVCSIQWNLLITDTDKQWWKLTLLNKL